MERDLWDERYASTDLVWSATPNRFVVAELTGATAGRAVDLGTGEGRNALWLAAQGWRVTAVDFSEVALAKGAVIAADRGLEVDWVQADLREYQPELGAYDLALIAYIQFPWPEFARVLRAAESALAPGGILLVVGHDIDNLTRGYGGPQDPALLHRVDDVVAALSSLTIVRAEQVRRAVPAAGGERFAIDTLVRAERR